MKVDKKIIEKGLIIESIIKIILTRARSRENSCFEVRKNREKIEGNFLYGKILKLDEKTSSKRSA